MRKATSTNAINEQQINSHCGMAYTLKTLGGRWKPAILCRLISGTRRYGELRKSIDGISERMLVAQLRELEQDGIIERLVYAEVPPRVEYQLSAVGETLKPILKAMSDWGDMHRDNVAIVKAALN